MAGYEEEQDIESPLLVSDKELGLTTEERSSLRLLKKDKEHEIESLLKVEFKDVKRTNAETFYGRVTNLVGAYSDYRYEQIHQLAKFLAESNRLEKLALDSDAPDSPDRQAAKTRLEAIKRLNVVYTLTGYIEELMSQERDRYLLIIKESESVDSDVKRAEIAKEMIKDHTTTMQIMYDKLILAKDKQLDDERTINAQLRVEFAVMKDNIARMQSELEILKKSSD